LFIKKEGSSEPKVVLSFYEGLPVPALGEYRAAVRATVNKIIDQRAVAAIPMVAIWTARRTELPSRAAGARLTASP